MYTTKLLSVLAKVNLQHKPPMNILGCSYFARTHYNLLVKLETIAKLLFRYFGLV